MATQINERQYTLEVHPDETAVDFLREGCGLTGTKLVCGAGVCGACTVLMDGVPTLSCLTPSQRLENKKVTTIEHYGPDNLHPVQRAFMACDGLQCGFCTPGFIIEGIHFFERWRKEKGKTKPSKTEIADALSGHLCRCGAYVGIFEAMQRACTGDFDSDAYETARVDALEKVTGQAKYTVDIKHEGQLEGRILRSVHPHAKVKSIDASEALNLPGVEAFVELLDKDRTVRYIGQEIGAVAATTKRIADEALEKIKVEYEVLPAVIGMKAARAEGAPEVYSGLRKDAKAPSAAEGILIPGMWKGNVRHPLMNVTDKLPITTKVRVNRAKARERILLESTYQTAAQVHTALEPHSSVATWQGDKLVVHTSTQACDLSAREIAEHFDLPRENVQVLCEYVGGGFGAKLRPRQETFAAVALAKAAKKSVRVMLDRFEEMAYGGFRPSSEVSLSLVATKDGKLKALEADAYGDAGVAIGSQIAVLMGFMYPKASKNLMDYDVVNHTPPGTPFRGPGGSITCWALEQTIDDLAYQLGESPLEFRRRHDPHRGRQTLYDWVNTIPSWRERAPLPNKDKGRFRRGLGLAVANWFYFFMGETKVEVFTDKKGIHVRTAAQDMGNGSRTVLANAVADVFGMAPKDIHVHVGNSNAVRGPLSGGSRTSNSVYAPAQEAAKNVQAKLLGAAKTQLALQNIKASATGVEHSEGKLSWQDLAKQVAAQSVVAERGKDKGLPAMPLAFGADDLVTGKSFTGGVHVTEVEVDTRLGKIKPLRVWGGMAVGKIFAPALARSQCYGGIIQGLGFALYEERHIDASGYVLNANLEDYRIPGIGDTPEMELHFLEEGFDHAQGKGVGLSELSTLAVAASVGNAVYHATGWRPHSLPILPRHILEGVK
ncbi:MAG: molybdopterin-dependent oxidoreductase [Trueperaceae bacterium]